MPPQQIAKIQPQLGSGLASACALDLLVIRTPYHSHLLLSTRRVQSPTLLVVWPTHRPSSLPYIIQSACPLGRLSHYGPTYPSTPPLFRPSYSRICLAFLASYPDALPAHLPFNPPRSSYPHIRISSTHANPQPLFPAGRNTQNHLKMQIFYFPGLGEWTVRGNNSEPRCWNCGIRSVDWTVRAAIM